MLVMKLSNHLLTLTFLLLATALSHGTPVPVPHRAVSLKATLYTYAVSGTISAAIHATKVNNATILNSLVVSGSVTGVIASDLDIVLGDNAPELDVINKHTLVPLYTLAKTGTAGFVSSTAVSGKITQVLFFRETILDYEFYLPQINVLKTGTLLTARAKVPNTVDIPKSIFQRGGQR